SSLGGFFTNQIALCSSSEAYDWLKKNKLTIHTAQLQDSDFYYKANFKEPCAIVMGTESLGLSSYWREKSDSKIRIPMMGSLDSLNVSVSTAILCYEAVRQRKG
ncbi:MAG: RNA methyltransferase, partial [Bacteroidia bacterium]|nr:RNA methyltransferase [Bacteroidia bacterium]